MRHATDLAAQRPAHRRQHRLERCLRTRPDPCPVAGQPGQWQAHDDAACKVDFWLRNLRTLRQSLEALNIPLLIRTIDKWDQAPQAVLDACRQHRVEGVHWNEEYGINEERRDQATRALLEQSAIQAHSYLDQLFFRPGTVLTRSGDYFQVFSQFKRNCLEHLHRSLRR